jgi:hypothetical protein
MSGEGVIHNLVGGVVLSFLSHFGEEICHISSGESTDIQLKAGMLPDHGVRVIMGAYRPPFFGLKGSADR